MDMWKDGSLERSKTMEHNEPHYTAQFVTGKENMALPKNYKKRNRIGVSDKWLC